MRTKNMADTLQICGWRPDLVERAVSALSATVASLPRDDEENQLAAELVRWLRSAASEDAADLGDYLERTPPAGDDESPWDVLHDVLREKRPTEDLIAALRELYPDPVPALCTLLGEALSPDAEWRYIDYAYQRATEALLALGTDESLAFMASRVNLLCWDPIEPLAELLKRHDAAFFDAVARAWPSLSWDDRAMLMLIFEDCGLSKAGLAELAFAADGGAPERDSRRGFVRAMAYSDDQRAEAVIRQMIDRALDELSCGPDADAEAFVKEAAHQLIVDVKRDVTSDQRERAARLGVPLSRPASRTAAG